MRKRSHHITLHKMNNLCRSNGKLLRDPGNQHFKVNQILGVFSHSKGPGAGPSSQIALRKAPKQGSQEELPKQGFPGKGSRARVPRKRFPGKNFRTRFQSRFQRTGSRARFPGTCFPNSISLGSSAKVKVPEQVGAAKIRIPKVPVP